MAMKRLLTKENKRSIKEAFKVNAVFRVINAAYKEQETRMETLKFSPEEIWVNCFIGFDKMLKNREEIEETTSRMWNDTFCELRDDADEVSRKFQNKELETATSCIIYSIVACMMASEDWQLIRHAESLMGQIAEHSELPDVVMPFNNCLESDFDLYIKEYIRKGKFISDRLESPRNYADPINQIASAKDRAKAKEGAKKRLEFMKGVIPETEMLIMTVPDFNKMLEAVDYFFENNVVKKQDTKIRTNLPISHLRYTFYLVYKNEGKCIRRDLWLDFLSETFAQMQDNKASISNHFSDMPDDYGKYSKAKKKK